MNNLKTIYKKWSSLIGFICGTLVLLLADPQGSHYGLIVSIALIAFAGNAFFLLRSWRNKSSS